MTLSRRIFLALLAACLLPLSARADDPAVRHAIEGTLRQLEAAAAAGDKEGWLAHIYTGDSEWKYEQTYFANDLKKKPAEKLELRLGDIRIGDGTAEGELTFAWNMPGKATRTVKFEARFIEQEGRWTYAGETWQKHTAPGVIVLHDDGLEELAARVVEAFTAIRGLVEEGFEMKDSPLAKHTQKIKLYGGMDHLQQSICLSYVDGLAGWNEPNESVKLLASRRTGVGELKRLLAHEYGHVATFATGPKANDTMPWWVLEGVAELSSESVAGSGGPESRVESWARNGRLAAWSDIADFDTIQQQWYGHVYTQGHHMIKFISGKWGREGRNAWLRAMGAGKSIDEATQEVFKLSFADLDAQWRASLPAKKAAEPKQEKEPAPAGGT